MLECVEETNELCVRWRFEKIIGESADRGNEEEGKKNSPQTTAEDRQSEGESEGNKTKHKVHISETVSDYVNVSERVSGDGM